MDNNDIIFLETLENLKIEVHVIGYKTEGESIIFLISDTKLNVNYYCGIVDFYENKDENLIKEFLTFLKIDKFDFCCWTHPHYDHCKGFDRIFQDNLIKNETIFYLPEGIYRTNLDIINPATEGIDFMKTINNLFSKNKNLGSLSVVKSEKIRNITMKKFKTVTESIDLSIDVVSPYSEQIRMDLDGNHKKKEPNIYSIGFILSFGKNFKIFLSGDMEDETLELLNKKCFDGVKIIKAPHHGSEGTKKIIQHIKEMDKKPYVVSTVYRRRKELPTPLMVSDYKNHCEKFICTGSLDLKNRENEEKENYGIASFYYYLNNDSVIKYGTSGNTKVY